MLQNIDRELFFIINRNTANTFFDVLMPLLSDRGYLLALPLLILAGIIAVMNRKEPLKLSALKALSLIILPVAAFFLADHINNLLKAMIARPRPCHALETVRILIRCPQSFSMPSGHAVDSFAFASCFVYMTRKLLSRPWHWYVLFLAGAIAFSRIYIGVHYPFDVVVGTALGCGIGWGLGRLFVLLWENVLGRNRG